MDVIALIHREEKAWGISFPDFPGCISAGNSLEEVLREGREALEFHIEGMVEDNESMPILRSIDEMRNDKELDFDSAELISVISVDLPGKAVRVQITLEESLLARLDRAADKSGATRSGYIAETVKRRLAG